MVAHHDDMRTVGELLAQYELADEVDNPLLLPNFQRGFEWEPEDWKSLLASLLLRYPSGLLLIGAATENGSKTMDIRQPASFARDIYNERLYERSVSTKQRPNSTAELKKVDPWDILESGKAFDTEYLLDGQQRITSLHLMLTKSFASAPTKHGIGHKRFRWFLDLERLGLNILEFPDLQSEFTHDQVKKIIVAKKHLKGDASDLEFGVSEKTSREYLRHAKLNFDEELARQQDLAAWCVQQTPPLLPLDECLRWDSEDATYVVREEIFPELLDDYKRLQRHINVINVDPDTEQIIDEGLVNQKFKKWRGNLRRLIEKQVLEYSFPVKVINAENFQQLSGIFSVINITGQELDNFDLLTARTSRPQQNIKDVFQASITEFTQSLRTGEPIDGSERNIHSALKFAPSASQCGDKELSEGIKEAVRTWSFGQFIRPNSDPTDASRIDEGEEYPREMDDHYGKVIALLVKEQFLAEELGPEWLEASDDPVGVVREFSQKHGNSDSWWHHKEAQILSLDPEYVVGREGDFHLPKMAAHRLASAYLILQAVFGYTRRSALSYGLHAVVLAYVLDDATWSEITSNPSASWKLDRIKKWHWHSVFAGAYVDKKTDVARWDCIKLRKYLTDISLTWEDCFPDRTQKPFGKAGFSKQFSMKTGSSNTLYEAMRGYILTQIPWDLRPRHLDPLRIHAFTDSVLTKEHIIPQKIWADHVAASKEYKKLHANAPSLDSPLNLTVLTLKANREWSSMEPGEKLDELVEVSKDTGEINSLPHHFLDADAIKDISIKETPLNFVDKLYDKRFEVLKHHVGSFLKQIK